MYDCINNRIIMALSLDILGYISEFSPSNQDKCRLMMTCKKISNYPFFFDYEIDNNNLAITLIWYYKFRRICNYRYGKNMPPFVTHLTFGS